MLVARNIQAHILKDQKEPKIFGLQNKKPSSTEDLKNEEPLLGYFCKALVWLNFLGSKNDRNILHAF